ncbi:nutritionally-regulated adipose and cardiac enriched protein homolog isoform 1-T3 [Thomomys bottae]
MRTAARTSRPDIQPEIHQTRKEEQATQGAPVPQTKKPQESDPKLPPSILRQSPAERASRGAPRKLKHVRFQEPLGVSVHYISRRDTSDTIKGPGRPALHSRPLFQPRPRSSSLLLRLSVCVLLGVVLGLCCGQAKPIAVALEDLQAWLLVLGLRLWHMALSCWHGLLQL